MPMVRRLRPALAAALIVLAAAPIVPAGAKGAPTGDDLLACSVKNQIKATKDGWARIAAPSFSKGGAALTGIATSPGQRGWIYATNGKLVELSVTGGCKWNHIYEATTSPEQPPGGGDVGSRVVTQMVAPNDTGLWIASYDDANGVARPHIQLTPDATPDGNAPKQDFVTLDIGLPQVGRPIDLAVSPRQGDRAYLLVEEPPDAQSGSLQTPVRRLYRVVKQDVPDEVPVPKLSWERVAMPAGFERAEGLVVSPVQSMSIWIHAGNRYAKSVNGGEDWTTAVAPGTVTAIDVGEGDTAAVYSKLPDGSVQEQMSAPGKNVAKASIPGTAKAVAHGLIDGVYAFSGEHGTYGFDTKVLRWTKLGPKEADAFGGLAFGRGGNGSVLLGMRQDAIYRFDLWPHERFLPPPKAVLRGNPNGDRYPVSGLKEPAIAAEHVDVTVAPGNVVEDPLHFGTPPSPTPVDVFFLMDTTMSMASSIKGLREGVNKIATELTTRTRGEACFGVGDVKDFAVNTSGLDGATPYKLVMPITCGDEDLSDLHAALDKLKESGGSNPQEEGQTIALTQAVRGDGMVQPPVPAGQDAKFKSPNRIIVLVTDAGFMQGGMYPTMDETIKTLHDFHNVQVVGVHVLDNNNPGPPRRDLTTIARATDTLAPEKGADCDGDNKADLLPGDPLVCETANESANIAPAIVGLLLGVKEPGTLAIQPDDPHGVVRGFSSSPQVLVNMKVENHLKTRAKLSCRADQDGMDLPVRFDGIRRATGVVSLDVVVHCRAPQVPPPPPQPQPRHPQEPVFDAPPPPAKPPVAPVIAPQFQPPLAQNPISNANPNAGFSQQDEQQFQVAGVTQGNAEEEQDQEDAELAMSALSSDDAAARVTLGCAMLLTAAGATAVGLRRRTQRRTSLAYVRR